MFTVASKIIKYKQLNIQKQKLPSSYDTQKLILINLDG